MSSLELAGIPRSEISMKGWTFLAWNAAKFLRKNSGRKINFTSRKRTTWGSREHTCIGQGLLEETPSIARGLGNGLNEWWSHEPGGLEPGSPVTEVLLATKSFERQLRESYFITIRSPHARRSATGNPFVSKFRLLSARRNTSVSILKSSTKLEVRRETECAGGDYA